MLFYFELSIISLLFYLWLMSFFLWTFISVVTQEYQTDAHSVYVISGNAALLKCEIPSFVADFVTVYSWTDNMQNEFFQGINKNYGKHEKWWIIDAKTIIIDRNSSSTAINILSPQSFLITIGKSQTQFNWSKQYIFQNKQGGTSGLSIEIDFVDRFFLDTTPVQVLQ